MKILNVCKECGKSGLFLQLDKDMLCEQCAQLAKNKLSSDQVEDILVDYVVKDGSLSKFNEYMKAQKAKESRREKSFDLTYNNLMQGKALEKQGKTDEALALYLKNLKRLPQGTDYYTRPCIILEKQKKYDKAIEICDLAIKCIKEKRFNADIEDFIHRRERLISKKEKAEKNK